MKTAVAFLALLLLPAALRAQDIKPGATLSLSDCIAIALRNDPDVRANEYTAHAQKDVVRQARSGYYPSLNAVAGYSSNHTSDLNALDPYAASSIGTYDYKTAGLTLNQLVYDFGKTHSGVKSGEAQARSAAFDVENEKTSVVHEVKKAYNAYVFAQHGLALSNTVMDQYTRNVTFARAHFDAKISPKYDVTKAEADLSSAKLDNIKAQNYVKLARVYLINTMNLSSAPDFSVEMSTPFIKSDIALDAIVAAAYAAKPDLLSLQAQADALSAQVSAARGDYYPALTASAGYNFAGSRGPLSQGWNAGLKLSANLFSGMATQSKVSEMENRLAAMRSKVDSMKLDIYLNAQQAYLNLLQYEQAVETSREQVRQSTENLDIANLRYQTGLGSPMEISDATVLYNNSNASLLNALYNYKLTEGDIAMIMGKQQ